MLQRSVKWCFGELENWQGGDGVLMMSELHSHFKSVAAILFLVGSSGIIAYFGRSGEGIRFLK